MVAKGKSAGEQIYEAARICGVPDSLRTSELNAWPEKRIKWALAGSLPEIPEKDVKDCYAHAWSLWASICGIEPEYASNYKTAHVILTAANLGGPLGVLADSYVVPDNLKSNESFDAIQRYDISEDWHAKTTPPPLRKISLPIVMCHEIGHAIGISHIADGNLLQPSYDPRVDRPQAGDIAEAVKRYGKPKETNAKKFSEWFRIATAIGDVVLGLETK